MTQQKSIDRETRPVKMGVRKNKEEEGGIKGMIERHFSYQAN